ncbi:rhodanese-like domain-containing protein [Variovorax sp. OV700]|uniref:rhodanese-like domain-containing protein n=1 Tax=Variovorax sp. OV700 TaxID=1882826 RepID=UPI0020C8D1F6|nr:rhodanese-like domain-containing protein [Variovorax sp. OV700]
MQSDPEARGTTYPRVRKATTTLPGARWFDPAAVDSWAAQLPPDRELVVYCVYGHEVGHSTAMRLRAAGLNARSLRGGIDGWKAAGRPLEAKPAGKETSR